MKLKKIQAADLAGKGVVGMDDTPNLSALDMQKKFEEVVRDVVIPIFNDNVQITVSKEDLLRAIFETGHSDMAKAVYDTNDDGKVDSADEADNALKLGGQLPAYYAKQIDVTVLQNGKISITKLWENASPTSTFAAQTIQLSDTDFDLFICISKNANNNEQNETSIMFLKNHSAEISYITANPNDSYYSGNRHIKITGNEFIITDCYGGSTQLKPALSNNAAIPIIVYGVKGVQQ